MTAGSNPTNDLGTTYQSAVIVRLIVELNVALSDVPTTSTVVTSARPIISAEAVDAVRRGLRAAFSSARCPDVLNGR